MSELSTIYDKATGKIISITGCTPDVLNEKLTEHPELGAIPGRLNGDTHFIQAGAPVERGPMAADFDKLQIAADGVDTATLSDLPIPCDVLVGQTVVATDDGTLALNVDMPGDYRVRVNHPHFAPTEWIVVAT